MTPVQINTNNHVSRMIILRTQIKMSWSFRTLAHLLFPDTLLSVDQGTTVSNNYVCVCVYSAMLSCVRLFVTPWTVAWKGPLSMGFPRQEYLS